MAPNEADLLPIAERQMARQLAETLDDVADQVRSGNVPAWALRAIAPSVQMIAHVLRGVGEPAGRAAPAKRLKETLHKET